MSELGLRITKVSYCKSLGFEDEPDYTYLKKLFTDCASIVVRVPIVLPPAWTW